MPIQHITIIIHVFKSIGQNIFKCYFHGKFRNSMKFEKVYVFPEHHFIIFTMTMQVFHIVYIMYQERQVENWKNVSENVSLMMHYMR